MKSISLEVIGSSLMRSLLIIALACLVVPSTHAQLGDLGRKAQEAKRKLDELRRLSKTPRNKAETPASKDSPVSLAQGVPTGPVASKLLWEHDTVSDVISKEHLMFSPDLASFADLKNTGDVAKVESNLWTSPVFHGTLDCEFLENGALFSTHHGDPNKPRTEYFLDGRPLSIEKETEINTHLEPLASFPTGALFQFSTGQNNKRRGGYAFFENGKGLVKTHLLENLSSNIGYRQVSTNGRFVAFEHRLNLQLICYVVFDSREIKFTTGSYPKDGDASSRWDRLAGVLDDGRVVYRTLGGHKTLILGGGVQSLPGDVVLIHGAMVLTKSRGFEGEEYYLNGKLWRDPMGTEVNPTFVATSVDHIGFHTRKPSGHFVRDDGKTMEALEPGVPFRGVPYVRWYRDTGKAKNFLIDFLTWGLFGFTGSDSFIPNADGKGFFMNYFEFPGVCVSGQFEGDPLLGRQKLFSIQANGHEIVRLSGAKRSTQGPVASIPIGRHALRMVVKDSYEKDNSTRYLFRCFELTW